MKRSDFYYSLPEELIAHFPSQNRSDSRLMLLDCAQKTIEDKHFHQITAYFKPGDLLVLNNTKVIPGRLLAHKETGGQVEILIERMINTHQAYAQIKSNKKLKLNTKLYLCDQPNIFFTVVDRQGHFFLITTDGDEDLTTLLDQYGKIPLPPYIKRPDTDIDRHRYQTVYAQIPGAIAAPTAGLHFDTRLLNQLKDMGVDMAYVTLHVGAGTFSPVRVENITEHTMHCEVLEVDELACEKINQAKLSGGRIIAVGTTSVRCLETLAQKQSHPFSPFKGETDIFIYPGYTFKLVEGLITNFHLPESTLLMLVSALAGKEFIFKAYHHAIQQRYGFFSYGDAMFIMNNVANDQLNKNK